MSEEYTEEDRERHRSKLREWINLPKREIEAMEDLKNKVFYDDNVKAASPRHAKPKHKHRREN